MSSVLLFAANDGGTGVETWLTNAAGTSATLIDLFPGPDASILSTLSRSLDGDVFFEASNGQSGNELYTSDGTVAGTTLFADVEFGTNGSFPFTFTGPQQSLVIGDTLYFSPFTTTPGQELWKTNADGPPELVRDVNPGSNSSFPNFMVDLNGTLLFSANDGTSGTELYRSDGTEAGTQRVADINIGGGGSSPFMSKDNLLNDTLFFSANDGTNGTELWRTDGTTAGTALVRDINPGAGGSSVSFRMADLDGTLYFSANDGTNGNELWRTDGTEAGTNLVTNINPGAGSSSILGLTAMDDMMLFFADNGSSGLELWRSDGSSSGTTLVRDINPGAGGSFFNFTNIEGDAFTMFDDKAWFIALDGSNGVELWNTDGTAGGTRLFMDINPGAGNAFVSNLAVADDLMYFSADNGTQGTELWVTDGTETGTRLVQDVRAGSQGSGATAIGVIDFNVAPTDVTLSGTSISENIVPATAVGTLAATDADGDALIFSLTDDAEGRFAINGTQLVTAQGFDFEAAQSHQVTVQVADPDGLTANESFTINVTNVNEAPGTVMLASQQSVAENAAAGAVVGTVGAIDPDGDVVALTLTDDAGGQFTLNGTTLQTTGPLDFEAGATRSVTVQATDPDGLTSAQTFTVNVTDVEETVDLLLNGTPGNDTLTGGVGNDTINGLDGTDNLIGGAGNDSITGGVSENDLRDNIFGGDGNDTIRGGYGNDNVRGDAGDDLVEGGFGADTVLGGTGNDSITGSGFGDLLFGAEGDDFINGGFGFDRVNGGDGADEFFHLGVAGHGTDFIQDYDGSEGDTLVFGNTGASAGQFQINLANTPDAGDGSVEEAFIIYRPTGQIMWALIDGAAQDEINLKIGGEIFDLMT